MAGSGAGDGAQPVEHWFNTHGVLGLTLSTAQTWCRAQACIPTKRQADRESEIQNCP